MLRREDCLIYLQDAVLAPPPEPPFLAWLDDNSDAIKEHFDARERWALNKRGLVGAREILEREQLIEPLAKPSPDAEREFFREYCEHCGALVECSPSFISCPFGCTSITIYTGGLDFEKFKSD